MMEIVIRRLAASDAAVLARVAAHALYQSLGARAVPIVMFEYEFDDLGED